MLLKQIKNKTQRIHFGSKSRENVNVKFTDLIGRQWNGSFAKNNIIGLCKVINFNNKARSLIIANGKGYLVDIKNKQLIAEINESQQIVSVVKTENPELIIIGNEHSITIISNQGLIKEIIPDFYVDSFDLSHQCLNSVCGKLESPINGYDNLIDFELDLSAFNLILKY